MTRNHGGAVTGLVPRPASVRPLGALSTPDGATRALDLGIAGSLLPERTEFGVCPDPSVSDEAYRVIVDGQDIRYWARTDCGAARAASTMAQLRQLPERHEPLVIDDYPRFAWRGLMIDVARSYRTLAELRSLVDLCAFYKLNVLHLHLTDDQAWRLVVPGYPELTRPPATTGGVYTVDSYRELQVYAAARFVTIVPEIDLPGHCAAVRRAYPSLPEGNGIEGGGAGLHFSRPLDVRAPEVEEFVVAVFTAVSRATAGQFVHIGGDEAIGIGPRGFAAAVDCAREAVRRCGKQPVGWQELSRAGIEPGEVAQHWVNVAMMELPSSEEELAQRSDLAKAGLTWPVLLGLRSFFASSDDDVDRIVDRGAKVLLSPQSHLYLDRPYQSRVAPFDRQEAVDRLGFPSYRPHDLRTAFDWNPTECGLPPESIAGIEATLFSETIGSFSDVTMLLLPRLLMAAEAGWSPAPLPWGAWRDRLAVHAPMWRAQGWTYFASNEVEWR